VETSEDSFAYNDASRLLSRAIQGLPKFFKKK